MSSVPVPYRSMPRRATVTPATSEMRPHLVRRPVPRPPVSAVIGISVLVGHELRNAALPALAFTGLQIGFLLGGAVIVEGVFAYPGIGGLALDAVATRDIPLVEAFVWVVAVMILAVNILTGVLTALIDPRLREDGRAFGSVA